MWFDVEEKGNTTVRANSTVYFMLWFDVEEKGNTTTIKGYQQHG